MKKITFLFSLFCFISVFSQNHFQYKENHFPVKYVLKNSTDTIKTRVQNIGIFTNKKFSPATYIKQVNMLDSLGNKTVISEFDIDYMEVTDPQNVVRKFTSSTSLRLTKYDFGLIEILFQGKLSWYRDYFYIGLTGYKMNKTDFLINKADGKVINESGFFNPGIKNNLKEKLQDHQDLVRLVDKSKKDEDIIKVLELYNNQ
ncbi:Uncharacterised protein [Chryseobacterium nakagawai]|uniref:GLPGLI family protein n=1 Tax=Chryseobacterium nakagawai TaxID=1241982 RepID=A0AAD0YJQ1_CHRNA|nr:hypothetical protein [Chryseobacterium nakagawai]AZA90194.1 hypothetical protein EG343_05980 [Chryseobacterium nakagawai]VEH21661.1 Uncharacterised protein [Chryseobacterium nakagawai]